MQLHSAQFAIGKAHSSEAFHLALPATTVTLAQKGPELDTHACCDGLNLCDRADDIEFHLPILSQNPCSGKAIYDQNIRVASKIVDLYAKFRFGPIRRAILVFKFH
jgi:hypothetical protein